MVIWVLIKIALWLKRKLVHVISDLKHIVLELTCTRLWVAQSHLIRKTHVDLEFIYFFLPIKGSTNCTDSITC